jgi:acetyl-CoA C-acetyltransferase
MNAIELKDIVVISGVRTPIGRFGGTLKDTPVYDLGAHVIRCALERVGLKGGQVDQVIFGHCRQAGNGPNPGRTASVRGGIPVDVPVNTINMACPSGMRSVALAAQAIQLGESEIIVAGGMDSMSTIPYLLKGARWEGFRMGPKTLEDGWSDSIDPLIGEGMGGTAENLVEKYKIPREEMDAFALASHRKAAEARAGGWFDEEIVPFTVPAKRKQPEVLLEQDETIREDTSLEKLAKLPAAFRKGGSVTAGNACAMSDGAVAVVVTSREKARALGAQPLFSVVSHSIAAVDPAYMGEGPAYAIPKALEAAGMSLDDMELIEINEAFAAQILTDKRLLNYDEEKLNVHGGAIALGHPTGISGARILVTLYNALRIRDGETGIASICGGGGVASAMIIKRED